YEIKIGHGRPTFGGRLIGCYFVPVPDTNPEEYTFFDRHGQVLKEKVQSNVQFDFHFPSKSEVVPEGWQITADFHVENLKPVAHGDWNIPDRDAYADEEDGTFHAQAGGGVPTEMASSATAY